MAILYDAICKTFTLQTDHTTYQMQVDHYGYLLHLYYGAKAEGCMDYLLTYADRGLSGSPYDAGDDRSYSLDFLPQEFPVQGTGDFRSPLFVVRDAEGVYGCDLRYRSHRIEQGKYALDGLPAVYGSFGEDASETLVITLWNERLSLYVDLLYGVLPKIDIITRSVIVRNDSDRVFTVEKLQSACLDFVNGDFDLITFSGRHLMERQPDRRRIGHGAMSVGSRRGASSHQYNPFLILADRDTTEEQGRCWSMQFVYSGGFLAEAERDQYSQTRVQMGLSGEKFSYPVEPGGTLTGPEVILSFSREGFSLLSYNLHRCIRKHVCRGRYRDKIRPVLLNSWEASYFDFTGASLLTLAKCAKTMGIEMLVVDDGWFGNRYDDNRALGDWQPNESKLGGTLHDLITNINAIGLKFGIWMEPEMVSEDSDLYRAHPDWALVIPGEKPVRGRNQLVLDCSRKEVCDYLYQSICSVLDQGNIEYLKWDYNRSIADVYSYTASDQGRVLYDYMLGLYDILEKLTARYPDLLIEGCSGGGGRFDAGMLYYTPQIWCSDNTDAIDRLRIQYGTSFGYPAAVVGAHVSACPSHQTGRVTPFSTRGAVAMNGGFGYELDPGKLTAEECKEIRRQISFYHEYAGLIFYGRYFRLTDPRDDAYCAWEYVSESGDDVLLFAVKQENHGNLKSIYVKPRGLQAGAVYKELQTGRMYAGNALMDMGFPLPAVLREYDSVVYRFRVESGDADKDGRTGEQKTAR